MFVAELGMSPKDFWELSIYDWSLWMRRIKHLREERENSARLQLTMYRQWMSLYYNSVSKEKLKPEDFYQFPEEIEVKEDQPKISPEELERKANEITKARKRNGQ